VSCTQPVSVAPIYRKPSGRTGSNHEWRRLRARILARDRHACTRCGADQRLEVHHANGNWHNDAPSNLVTLCGSWHDDTHEDEQSRADTQGRRRDSDSTFPRSAVQTPTGGGHESPASGHPPPPRREKESANRFSDETVIR